MANENQENGGAGNQENGGAQQQQNQGQQQQQQNNAGGDSEIASPLDYLGGLVSQETLDKLSGKDKGQQQNAGQQNQNQQQGQNQQGQNQQQGQEQNQQGNQQQQRNQGQQNQNEEEGAAQQQNQNGAGANKQEEKSVFGLNKNKGAQKKEVIVIENPDQMLGVIKSNFGMEIKDIKETPKFFETVQNWRKDAQRVPDLEKESKAWKGIVETLPEDLLESVKLYHSGKEYTTPFTNKPKFDFSKKAEEQDIKALVNHYFPGKFTEEDFKEETKSPALEIAQTAALKEYNSEKQTLDTKRAQVHANAQKQLADQKAAVKGSVEYLKRSFPDMEEDSLKEVATILEGGPNSLLQHFYNQDGTVKPEAAEMFMLAKYGKSEIQRMMGLAANIAETKTNEELLSRGSDTPKPKNTPAQNTVSKEAQEKISELQGMVKHRQKTF